MIRVSRSKDRAFRSARPRAPASGVQSHRTDAARAPRPARGSMLQAARARALVALVLAILATVPSTIARAQNLTPERVQIALAATDQRIGEAERQLSGAGNAGADTELGAAKDFQARAREALARGRLVAAGRLTFEARRHADRTVALARGLPDPDRVLAQLDRTRDLLDRRGGRIESCTFPRAQSLARNAGEMQSRAEEAGRSGRYLAALQLTMGAREQMHRALRLCRMEENIQDLAGIALHRTDDIIARVQAAVSASGNDEARESIARSVALEAQAQQDYRAGNFEASLRETQSARASAYHAARITGAHI